VVDVELIAPWILAQDDEAVEQIYAAIEVLEQVGPNLGRPLVDTIANSRYANMKELRPGSSGRSEIRILFVFDPKRQGILLVAGDKAGDWSKWYKRNIPIAEQLYEQHLKQLKEQNNDDRSRP
jgi:hypothetical protein